MKLFFLIFILGALQITTSINLKRNSLLAKQLSNLLNFTIKSKILEEKENLIDLPRTKMKRAKIIEKLSELLDDPILNPFKRSNSVPIIANISSNSLNNSQTENNTNISLPSKAIENNSLPLKIQEKNSLSFHGIQTVSNHSRFNQFGSDIQNNISKGNISVPIKSTLKAQNEVFRNMFQRIFNNSNSIKKQNTVEPRTQPKEPILGNSKINEEELSKNLLSVITSCNFKTKECSEDCLWSLHALNKNLKIVENESVKDHVEKILEQKFKEKAKDCDLIWSR